MNEHSYAQTLQAYVDVFYDYFIMADSIKNND